MSTLRFLFICLLVICFCSAPGPSAFAQVPVSTSGLPVPAAAVPASNQTVTPASTDTPPSPLFHLEAGVAATFLSGGKGTTATLIDSWLPVKSQSKRFPELDIMYRQIIVPAYNGQSYQMGMSPRWNVGQFTKSTSWGAINPQDLTLYFNATFGSWRMDIPASETMAASQSAASFAFAITGGVSYKLPSSIVGAAPLSIRAEYGVFHANKLGTFGIGSLNDPAGILGVTLRF